MHYKFAITKSPTIAAAAAPAANGDLAMAACIMVWYGIGNNNGALHKFTHCVCSMGNDSRRAVVYDDEKTSRYSVGSEERVGVFSHFAHSRNKITQGVASH